MIYICWEEIAHEFTGWKYVGNGETVPTMRQTTVKRSALWSTEETEEMRNGAESWIINQRPGGWVEIRK